MIVQTTLHENMMIRVFRLIACHLFVELTSDYLYFLSHFFKLLEIVEFLHSFLIFFGGSGRFILCKETSGFLTPIQGVGV